MGFGELLGNERLKENLSGSLRRDRVSHFYLIAGPSGCADFYHHYKEDIALMAEMGFKTFRMIPLIIVAYGFTQIRKGDDNISLAMCTFKCSIVHITSTLLHWPE